MNKIFLVLTALVLFSAQSVLALSLDEAKAKGLVGETPSGYLEAVQSSPDANAVAADINGKRRAEYQAIAQKNGTPLQAVEELAGKKAIERTAPGNYVKVNGAWVKK